MTTAAGDDLIAAMSGRAATAMALLFACGSTCFLLGPLPGYLDLVGPQADAATFFAGSVLFTAGGALQSLGAFRARHADAAAWWAAVIQSAGTLFFNVTTFRALDVAISNPDYERLVWRPDALGSACFLLSGVIAYRAACPGDGWQPAVNLLGCVLFAVAAVAGYVVPETGSMLDLAAANWTTCLGAACFLACALSGLRRPAAATGQAVAPARAPISDSSAPSTPRASTITGHRDSEVTWRDTPPSNTARRGP